VIAVTEEQIIGILRGQEIGAKTAGICRKRGLCDTTFSDRKAKYDGLDLSERSR